MALVCLSLLFTVHSRVQRSEEGRLGTQLVDDVRLSAAGTPLLSPEFEGVADSQELAPWVAQGAYAFVVDTRGRILTPHPENYSDLAQERLFDPSPVFQGRAGFFVDRVGQHRLVAYAPTSTPGRRLVTILPLDEALVATRELWRVGLWLVLISMIGSAAFGMLFASHIAEPVRLLTATARSVTDRGDLSIRSSLRTTDEVGDLSRAFDRMTAKIQQAQDAAIRREKLAALGQLLSGTAHELNNPLAAILMNAQLLESEDLPDPILEIARTIHTESRRAAKIVGNLLSFARPRPPERRTVHLNEAVLKAVDFHRYEMTVEGIKLTEQYDSALPTVFCDPDQIQQVVLNLVSNARHALSSRRDAELRVATRREGEWADIVVEDNGPGIAPETLQRIFDPFFTTRSDRGGTGLGLFIVHQIVKEHGGEIEVASEFGRGSQFTVRLPIGVGAPEMPTPTPLPTGVPQGLSVLLIDDEQAIATSASAYLARHGYRVRTVSSGWEAWKIVQQEAFDVIVADFRLPDLPGSALYEMLRESRPQLAQRTLFITGDTLSEATRTALAQTQRPYLEKPFSLERLHNAIEQLADSRPGQS